MNNLLVKDGLLGIAILLGSYGVEIIKTDFYKGLILIGVTVLVIAGRALLKKFGCDTEN